MTGKYKSITQRGFNTLYFIDITFRLFTYFYLFIYLITHQIIFKLNGERFLLNFFMRILILIKGSFGDSGWFYLIFPKKILC
ncbi:hypothetical protein B5V89_13420 [Heyndrickxia sporothermodurans]|nr:hypothetical protein B5V89_13420 [Heyndrickxia sporothermodurans]